MSIAKSHPCKAIPAKDKGVMLAEEMLSWQHNNNVIFPSVDMSELTLTEVITLAYPTAKAVFCTI